MLSLQEAERFAVEVLKVPFTAERVKNDPVSLLNELIRAFHTKIPFQDISLISMPAKERRMPTVEQIKEDVFAGRGGLCYTLNTFMKLFLEALGYAAHHIAGTVTETINGHIMTRVDIEGNVFLVDVGCGYPTFEAVPVNFEEESVVYKHSFLEYKFVKSKETTTGIVIKRFHRTSKTWKELFKRTIKMDQDGWWRFYHVDLTPRNLDFFLVPMTRIYTTAGVTPFHDSLRLIVFPNSKVFGFKDKTQVVKKDTSCVLDYILVTSDEVIQAVTSHFPVLKEAVKAAIINLGWD